MNYQFVIKEVFNQAGERLIEDQTYPHPHLLLPDLQHWYAYGESCGHCIVTSLSDIHIPDGDPIDWLVMLPVLTVLRGYQMIDGYVVSDMTMAEALTHITDKEV